MPLPGFLSIPLKGRRARSKARSEADAIQDPSEDGLLILPTESDQDRGSRSRTVPATVTSTLQNQVSSGTRAGFGLAIHLTVLPRNIGNVVSNPTQSTTKKAKRPKPWDRILNRSTSSTGEDKSGSGLGSTVYASTKVVVDVVKESSDVFPPLKSVAGCLMVILKHYDVCPVSPFPFMMLMATPASDGQSANDRIFDTPTQTAWGIAPHARSRERGKGAREEGNPQTVTTVPKVENRV